MSLETPEKIRSLQRKLYCKAKAEPAFRFYVLYDKICREDVLLHAYALVRANAGAPGVDRTTFEQIEASGAGAWLAGLREELVSKTYRPDPVRRVLIPKPGGGERPLGIPTIRDRVIQTAAKIVLEPVFEADFEDSAYGYRPRRSAIDAVKEAHRLLCRGHTDVVDGNYSPPAIASAATYRAPAPNRAASRVLACSRLNSFGSNSSPIQSIWSACSGWLGSARMANSRS
jgi:RNA-directed DNA polymerase